MAQLSHSTFWENDAAPAVLRARIRERASRGAAITLGKKPPLPTKDTVISSDRLLPPPLTTVPPDRPDNRQAIIDAVFAHHKLTRADIVQRHGVPRASACLQELAYRLIKYGKRSGNRLSYAEVGRMLKRHQATIRYCVNVHEQRMREHRIEDADA